MSAEPPPLSQHTQESHVEMPKSYIALYWTIWIIAVTCLITASMTKFFDVKEVNLVLCYMFPIWGSVMILNLVEERRWMSYLKQHHEEQWKLLHGGFNTLRKLPFVYSDEHFSDPVLKQLKLNYRRFIKLTLVIFVTFIPLSVFVSLITDSH